MSTYSNKNMVIKWIVLLIDAAIVAACFSLFAILVPENCPQSIVNHTFIATCLYWVAYFLFSAVFPLVIHNRIVSFSQIIHRNFSVVILSQGVFALLWHMMTRNSNGEVFFNLLFCLCLCLAIIAIRLTERYILQLVRARGRNTRSVIFVGSDPANLMVYQEIMMDATTGYRVIGYYSNDEIKGAPESLRKLGTRADLQRLMKEDAPSIICDEIYCSLSHKDEEEIVSIMHFCNTHVARFFYVPRVMRNMQWALKPQIVGGNVLFTNIYEPLSAAGNRMTKRLFDVFFSTLALIIIAPFVPIIALIIKVQSPGPIFFRQRRTGLDGRDFTCIKFRSMEVNDEADTRQATADDDRKFPFGAFIRKTNIDELPQFYNVLRGDMSIVGPRPHMLYHTEVYSKLLEKYMIRHLAKPGITGLAQVSGFRGETTELSLMEGRVKKDIQYIENWSLWLDIKICLLTAKMTILLDEKAI